LHVIRQQQLTNKITVFNDTIFHLPLFCFRITYNVRCLASEAFNFETFVASNEPMPSYAPGSKERDIIDDVVAEYEGKVKDVPIVIGDEEIFTKDVKYQVCVCSVY